MIDWSWAGRWPWSPRCRAVLEPEIDWPQALVNVAGGMVRTGGHAGRCELAPHPRSIDHALERGLETPRWSTRLTVVDMPTTPEDR